MEKHIIKALVEIVTDGDNCGKICRFLSPSLGRHYCTLAACWLEPARAATGKLLPEGAVRCKACREYLAAAQAERNTGAGGQP